MAIVCQKCEYHMKKFAACWYLKEDIISLLKLIKKASDLCKSPRSIKKFFSDHVNTALSVQLCTRQVPCPRCLKYYGWMTKKILIEKKV